MFYLKSDTLVVAEWSLYTDLDIFIPADSNATTLNTSSYLSLEHFDNDSVFCNTNKMREKNNKRVREKKAKWTLGALTSTSSTNIQATFNNFIKLVSK